MKIKLQKLIALVLILNLFLVAIPTKAYTATTNKKQKKTRVLFLYDCSQSMFGRWSGKTKLETANKLLSQLMDTLKVTEGNENLELGLRVYGHQYPVTSVHRSCVDTKLEVPIKANNYDAIKNKLASLYPRGTTPIAYSLEQAASDFSSCTNCRNIIILITDGVEECDGDPCAISLALQRKKIILKPFVIGLGLDLDLIDAFKCVGKFYEAKSEESFKNVLRLVVSQAIGNTSVQVDLMNQYGKPTETNVNMSFYNSHNKKLQYNYIHTLNERNHPDTLPINPVINYDITVHTIPPVSKKNIRIEAGRHNTIPISTPQGNIKINMTGADQYNNLQVIIRRDGNLNTLNVQGVKYPVKYITGVYDVEALTLPRTIIKRVRVTQSKTTNVYIPQPGTLNLTGIDDGVTSIMVRKGGFLKKVYDIPKGANIATLPLQPGIYTIVNRGYNVKKVEFSREKNFNIFSGKTTNVKF